MSWPYDPDHLTRTRDLLYAHVPEFYKHRDRAAEAADPPETAELLAVIEALAAPLAAVRQSIEELYADLFVESAGAGMLGRIAASLAVDPVFSDPEALRRDLASAMRWRRRKGTPAMLEEMARALSDRQVALREGWQAVMLTQDLDLLRPGRALPDLRAPSVAERAAGPLATLARLADPRPIAEAAGHVHPRHLVHWAFPTRLHPLRRAACHELPPGAGDRRFAFDAAGDWRALRVRATGIDDRPGTDRVPDGLFAESPGDWFGCEGRFTVRLTGVPAAAARDPAATRAAATVPADITLGRRPAHLHPVRIAVADCSGNVGIELISAPLTGLLPDLALAEMRGAVTVGPAGLVAQALGAGTTAADHVLLLRLRPEAPAASRMLGETVLEIEGTSPAAPRAPQPEEAALAQSGYRRGALFVRIPALQVDGERLFWLGADGALHAAQAEGGLRPLELAASGRLALPGRAVASAPVGPVWPEAAETAERAPFAPALAAPGAAPAVLHGGMVLRANSAGVVGAGVQSALVFALASFAGERRFDPMLRLVWAGGDPRDAEWSALDAGALPLAAADLAARFAVLGAILTEGRSDLALAVRFECSATDSIFTPAEVAFTGFDGQAVLIHLPELLADLTEEAAPDGTARWPRGPAPLAHHSAAVQVGADGSTWAVGTTALRRKSLGPAAPLPGPVAMRRREAGWRRLCPWQNETAVAVLGPTRPGRLDVDPAFGLFALNTGDGIVPHPPAADIPAPPAVTVDLEAGATMELGALPVDHRRFLNRLPPPATRLVSVSGHLGRDATPAMLALPRHRSVAAALAAAAGSGARHEVIEIVDSGFYAAEALVWPVGPSQLAIRAAAFERPVIEVASSVPGLAAYESLDLAGVALVAVAPLDLPPAQQVTLAFVSMLRATAPLRLALHEATGVERVTILRSALGPLHLAEAGEILVSDSLIDAGADDALAVSAPLARLTADRVTIAGRIETGEMDLSDTIVTGRATARERFRGCLRFCLVGPGSETPRRHRVLESEEGPGGQPIRAPFLSRDRMDPAWLRLDPAGDARILAGASDGGEMGAFNAARLGELMAGLAQRLAEHTPAGLRTGIVVRL